MDNWQSTFLGLKRLPREGELLPNRRLVTMIKATIVTSWIADE